MFEIARMDYTQYRKHFFPKQQDGWDILSCCFASPLPPQRCPARLFIDDNCKPRSAAVVMGDFVFLSGEPKLSFLKEVAGRDGLLLIARNEGWQEQLPALAGESFADYKCYPRYRFSLAAKEDQLQQILSSLPEGMRLERIDQSWFEHSRKVAWMRDFCSQFACWEDYARWGCGFLLTKEGRPLSGASSYLVSESGFTIQVQTEDSQQGRGYAKFPSAALIAAALEQGIYPDWDADNEASARLAQRLDYRLEGSYQTILVQQRV